MLTSVLNRSLASLVLRLTNVACAFAVAACLARLLPTSEMGIYFLLMSAAVPLSMLTQQGAATLGMAGGAGALARGDADSARRNGSRFLGFTVRNVLIIATACGVAGAVLWFVRSPGGTPWMLAAWGIVAGSLAIQATASEILRGLHEPIRSTWVGGLVVNALLVLALATLLLTGAASAPTVFIVLVGCYASSACIALSLLRANGIGIPLRVELSKGERRESIFVTVNSVAGFAYSSCDLWIAGTFLSLHDAAIYGAATRISALLLLPVEAMETVTAPLLARTQLHPESVRGPLRRATAFQTAAVVLALGLVWVFGADVLSLAFGPDYAAGIAAVLPLGVGIALRASLGPNGYMLLLNGDARALVQYNVLAAVLFVPVEIAAGWYGGLPALALAAGCATAGTNVALAWAVRRRTGWNLTVFTRVGSAP